MTGIYLAFLITMFASFLIYQVERDSNEHINSYGDALWLGLVSLTTIGYGDIVASTPEGKIITSTFAVMGISFYALPAGILSTGFALKVQEQGRVKHSVRKRIPAATLIQRTWRFQREHKRRIRLKSIHNLTPTIFCSSNGGVSHNGSGHCTHPEHISKSNTISVKFIEKLKVFSARQKFREALKPYDVRDVMEQHRIGNVDILGRIKCLQQELENVTERFDQIETVERRIDALHTKFDHLIQTIENQK